MNNRLIVVVLVLCAFTGSILALGRLDSSVMPKMYNDEIYLEIEMPLGTRYSDTKEVMLSVMNIALEEIAGYKNIIGSVGNTGDVLNTSGVHQATITVLLDLDDPLADDEDAVQSKLRARFSDFPDASFNFPKSDLEAAMGGYDIDIMFNYNEVEDGMAMANRIVEIMQARVPEVQDIDIDMDQGLPQINVSIDRARAYNMGLNVINVAMEISASMDSITATTLRQDGDEYDINLQLAEEYRTEIPHLGRIFVRSSNGLLIPVSNFAELERTLGPVNINRENQVRTIHITASVIEGYSIKAVEDKIRGLLDEQGITVTFSGATDETADMMRTFGMILALALILVFGVMAAQYESFLDPFINFCTIPLIMIGVVMIHILTGNTMSFLTMMGIIMLAGLVTSNGILLVDYTNQLRRQGMGLFEACIEAGANRFRPVIMSSITTMLALSPMAFFPGKSSTVTAPIGLVVFGGLASATVITLFFIPVIYSLFHGREKELIEDEV